MLNAVAAVSISVPDLQQAKQWYRQFLAVDPVFEAPFAVLFVSGGCALSLVPDSAETSRPSQQVVAYWGVEDLDEAWQRLIDAGAKPQCEPISTVTGARMARLTDPFGNIFGIIARPSQKKRTLEDQPSDSALGVALARTLAAMDPRDEVRGPDNLAELFLAEETRRALKVPRSREWLIGRAFAFGSYQFFIARTRYIDDLMRRSLDEGVPQIVFLGAGYDSRAYRFRDLLGKTRVFELDIAPTQERKKRILAEAGIAIPPQVTFVTINFAKESIGDVLTAAGFDPHARTLFVWEGVAYYLKPELVDSTLAFVRANSGPGSAIFFDYMMDAPDMPDRPGIKETLAAMSRVYAAEPIQSKIPEGALPAFLKERGFSLLDHLPPEEMERRFLKLSDGSSAGPVLACFSLALAGV